MGPPLLVFLIGCGLQPPPPSGVKPTPPKTNRNNAPQEIAGQGIALSWIEKTPQGGVRRVMDIKAESGILNAEQESGVLNRASGLLYRDNRVRASFISPIVEAAREKDTVTARGGVTVHSVDPPGGKLTADRVVWYAKQDKIVATGKVYVEYRPQNADRPFAWGGPYPRVTFDTQLSKIHIP